MSTNRKTNKRPKGSGYEYWTPRPGKGVYSPGGNKIGKRMTHKAERRAAKRQTKMDQENSNG